MDQRKILNALNLCFSPNIEAVIKLLSLFSLPEEIYYLNEEKLKNLGFKEETISNFLKKRKEIDLEKEWQRLEKERVRIILNPSLSKKWGEKEDKEYPFLLKEISRPPLFLYLKGDLLKEDNYFSCVGTRWPSDYGKMITDDLAGDLAFSGFTIVSGLAKGIDSLSHKACLSRNKRTIAIVATGLDIVYPFENRKLAKEIEKNGAIISEFPLGTPPFPYNFPLRNRIIAGISKGALIIEAKKKSGALITANLALEEGREVFAVPGPIFSKTSEGPNNLIKQGAHLVTEVNDILAIFNLEEVVKKEKEIKGETEEEKLILEVLKDEPLSIEEIIKKTKLEAAKVNSGLILMEVNGKIKGKGEKYMINS